MRNLIRIVSLTILFAISISVSYAQSVGDYRSNAATMNWITVADWQTWNGSEWVAASTYPGESGPAGVVTIQAGNTVAGDAPSAVCGGLVIQGSLNMNTGTNLEVQGNWTNNGNFDAGAGTITFSGAGSVAVSGSSTSAFYNLTLNKTNGLTDVVDIDVTGPLGSVACSHTLTMTSGLLKMSTGTVYLNCSSGFTISQFAGIWVDGSTLNTGGFTITNEGLIRISSGTATFGTQSGNSVHTQVDGAFEITGGNVFIAGRLENSAGGTLPNGTPSGINISAGTVTLATVGNGLSSTGSLDVTTNGAFNFTGGTIVFQNASSATTAIDISLVDGTGNGAKTTINGTFQLGNSFTSPNSTFIINSEIPLYNLTINDVNSPSVQIAGNDLTISNQLTMGGGNIDAATNNKNLILSNPAINSIANPSGYVIGAFTRAINSSGVNYLFPVGNDANKATPLELYFSGQNSTGSITITSVAGDAGNWGSSLLNSANRVNNYWGVVNNGVTFTSMGGKLTYPLSFTGSYKVGIFNGTSWGYPTVSASTANSTTFDGMGSLGGNSIFALAECISPTITLDSPGPAVCRGTTSADLSYSATTGSPDLYRIVFDATAKTAGFADVSGVLSVSPITVAVPGGTVPATYSATLYVSNEADCESDPVGFSITINPITSISSQSTAAQTQCEGGTFTPIMVTASGTGTLTYQWYSNASAGNTGGTSLGTTNGANTNSYTPQTTAAGTLYYYCVVHSDCGSDVASLVSGAFITNPPTSIDSQLTATQTECIGGTFTPITVTASGTGTLTYQWYSNASANNTGGTTLVTGNGANTNSYTPQATTAGTLYYYCIVHSDCGSDVTSAVSGAFVTNPATSINSQSTAAQTQCESGTFTPITVTASGTGTLTYQWYSNASANNTGGTSLGTGNGANTNSYTPQSTTAGTLYYYCVVHSDCGTDITSAVSGAFVTNPTPTATPPADLTYCMGETTVPISLVGTPSPEVVFDITGGSAVGLSNKTGVTKIPAFTATTGTAVVTITPRANGCTGNPVTFYITVNPRPNIHLSISSQIVCSGSNANVSLSSSTSGTTFSWTVYNVTGAVTGASDGSGDVLDQTLYNNSATSGSVTYQFTAYAGGCEGATVNFKVTVNPEVSATISGTTTVCQKDTPDPPITFTASGGTAPYTFTYNINGGANQQVTAASANTVTINAPTSVDGTFDYNLVSVAGSTGCDYPQTGTATVTVKPLPKLTSSLTPSGICSNTTFNYTHESSILNTDFYWVREVVPGISNPREEGTTYPDETLVNTTTSPVEVTYYYTLTADGCENTQEVKVMVTQSPELTSTMPDPICSGTNFSYVPTSSINPGTTITWTRYADTYGNTETKSGTGNPNEILYNNSTTPITVTYHFTLSSNGCTNPTDFQVNVTVTPAPMVTASASEYNICPGTSVNLFSSSNITSALPTTILTEDFNGSASGWVNNNAGNATWTLRTSLGIGSGNQIYNSGSQFYVSDMRNSHTTATLTSPSFSTQGYTSVTLTFSHYYRDNSSSNARVRWSIDGTSWNDLQVYNNNYGTATDFVSASVDIPVGEPIVYLQFRYHGDYDYYWAIDNVSVTGVPQSPATISWTSSPAGFTSAVANPTNVSPTETTTYTVTYTDPDTGCSGNASTTVTVYPQPDATIHADYCVSSPKIRLTTGSFSSYNWSPLPLGETNGKQYIDIDIAGIYTVTVTDANGCTGTASINVSNEYVVNGSFTDGNTGFVTPATGGNQYTYVADGGGNTELYPEGLYGVGTNAQTYHPNFWGVDHTTGTGKFMIVNGFPGAPQPIVWQETINNLLPNTDYYFSAWAISLNSAGNDAQLQFSINGTQLGTVADLTTIPGVSNNSNSWHDEGRFYGVWNSGSNTSAVLSIVDLQTAPSGNDFGLDDISFGILDPSPAEISPSKGSDVCSGGTIELFANVVGGKEPITYTWVYPNGLISHDKDPVIPNATEDYSGTYTLTVTDWYGCAIDPKTVDVVVYQAPTVDAGPDQLYGCSATSSFTLNGSIGGSAISGTWTTSGDGSFDDVHSMTAVYTIGTNDITNGEVTLTLTTDDPAGPCGAVSHDMTITIHRSPELTVDVAAPTCAGFNDGSATASVTNGTAPFTYLWSDGQTTAKATGLANGTFTVTVTDANNCTDTKTIDIVEPTPLVVSPASFTPPTCYGGNDGTATVNAEGGTEPYVYQWDAATGNQTTKTATGLTVGTYLFTVTDANGCNITSDFVLVTQPDAPTLDCPDDPDPVLVTGGATSAPVILTDPSYDPICQILSWTMSGATVVSTPVAGTVPSPYTFNVGTTVVTYSAVNKANEVLTCSFNVVVIGGADLAITKTANPSPVNTGDPIVYTITVTNAGPAEATSVKIADVIADLPSPEFTTDLANGPWIPWVTPYDAGNIANGGSATIYIKGTVPVNQCAAIDNTATVTSNTNDPDLANNQVTITTPVTDNKPPSFTLLTTELEYCVSDIISAVYNQTPNAIDPEYDDLTTPRPDYYLFKSGSTIFDLDPSALKNNFNDNCCAVDDLILHWRIDFSPIPDPDPTHTPLHNPITKTAIPDQTGQPSLYPTDIEFPGDGITFTDVVHRITYWLEDCNGNKSAEQWVNITIKPRPQIIKMN